MSATDRPVDITLAREMLSRVCHALWNNGKATKHLWSIPADTERDFDLILVRALDELEARRADPSPADRPSGWQPIETAPKDGSPVVIGFDPTRDDDDGLPHGVDFMRWMDKAWRDPLTHRLRPTHWMPLPTPPEADRTQEPGK